MIGPSRPSTIGPSLPPTVSIGPTLPPTISTNNDSDSDDDFGPSLPPELLATRSQPTASTSSSTNAPTITKKQVLGPTLPPRNFRPAAYEDEAGPMPLPSGSEREQNDGVREFREREEREEEKRRKAEAGKGVMKREEWMMVLPKEISLLSSMDSTKLKSRSFAQATPHSGLQSGSGGSEGPNLWTETPAERTNRLNDEMLGIKRKAEVSNGGGGAQEVLTDDQRRKRERDRGLREEVEKHNKSARSSTLLDSHSSSKRAKKDNNDSSDKDGGKEIWDRDRDMSLTGRLMQDGARATIVKDAKELGGRFSSGSYL